MTVVAADLDEDGWPDIYVACDSTPSLLFMNNHDGTFREEGVDARRRATAKTAPSRREWASAIGDYDLDGHLDIFKTHFADDTSGLYHNDGNGNFRRRDADVAASASRPDTSAGAPASWISTTTATRICSCVTGNVYPEVERKLPQYANKTPRAVFRNLGNGTFEELIGRGRARALRRRTAAVGARSATSTTTATWTCSSSI